MTIANYVRTGILALAAGCLGEQKLSEPKPTEYKELAAVFLPFTSTYSGVLYAHDENEDGQVDWIGLGPRVMFVALSHTPKAHVTELTRTMTPQMRAAASTLLKANQDLALLIDQEEFRLQQGGR